MKVIRKSCYEQTQISRYTRNDELCSTLLCVLNAGTPWGLDATGSMSQIKGDNYQRPAKSSRSKGSLFNRPTTSEESYDKPYDDAGMTRNE